MIQITPVNAQAKSQIISKWAGDKLERFDAVSRQLFALTTRTRDLLPFFTGPFHLPTSSDDPSNPAQGA